ncbi:MAG: FAD-dependent oxidoreductase [Candidatus Thorarchaeota archaeon]
MKRDLESLTRKKYDVAIIGAGIFGCCALWESTRRGLSAILIDKGDFSQATSANHYKMVHGGIRYLQHADFNRVHESSKERSALLRIAPHLVSPLPIIVPTYGHGIKGKELLSTGLLLYNLLTYKRNNGIQDKDRQIPGGTLLSTSELLEIFPGIEQKNLTGGVLFYDAQMYNPPRIALSFLQSAIAEGANAANYLEANGFLQDNEKIFGIKAKDVLTGEQLEIQSKIVLNSAGPWANDLLEKGANIQLNPKPIFSRDLGFVVSKKFNDKFSFACQIKSTDADALIDRGGRHIFISPWRDYTLVGVWHKIYKHSPDMVVADESELQAYINDVNSAYPIFNLSLDDITMVNTGLTLFGEENKQGERTLSFGKRSLLIDHESVDKKKGIVTLIGVRATTARGMAEKAIDLILKKLQKTFKKSDTEVVPIDGGSINGFENYLNDAVKNSKFNLEHDIMKSLIHNYGNKYENVLTNIFSDASLADRIGNTNTIKAQIIYAIREEMAQKLSDVIFRRTDVGTGANPGKNVIRECADLMAKELNWDNERKGKEIIEISNTYSKHGSIKNYSNVFNTDKVS